MIMVVPGPPVPCGRPRLSLDGHAYMPERTRRYERLVRRYALASFERPIEGPVALMAVFFCHNRQRRDVDNLLKSVMDGINGVAFLDDSQVVEQAAVKLLDRRSPRAVVCVHPVSDIRAVERRALWDLLSRWS